MKINLDKLVIWTLNRQAKIFLRESYLHTSFTLGTNNETTQQKKKKIEKFIEEPDFVELSTQAKHLRMRILHGHYLIDSPLYYC